MSGGENSGAYLQDAALAGGWVEPALDLWPWPRFAVGNTAGTVGSLETTRESCMGGRLGRMAPWLKRGMVASCL